jgi:hypothetical protein
VELKYRHECQFFSFLGPVFQFILTETVPALSETVPALLERSTVFYQFLQQSLDIHVCSCYLTCNWHNYLNMILVPCQCALHDWPTPFNILCF